MDEDMEDYKNRIADALLAEKLSYMGAVLVQGPKRMPPPSLRMVLVATGDLAYRRKEDGIIVCPIGCIK